MTAAEKIVEYVRQNHNSRSDKLVKLIAEYDVERAIAVAFTAEWRLVIKRLLG